MSACSREKDLLQVEQRPLLQNAEVIPNRFLVTQVDTERQVKRKRERGGGRGGGIERRGAQ